MTCTTSRNLQLARAHAATIDAAERCAPEVSAPYLTAAIERCKLPIAVSMGYSDRLGVDRFHVRATDLSSFGESEPVSAVTPSADFATEFYLRLCARLSSSPAASILPDAHAAAPAAPSPDGAALSSRSAAASQADSPADATVAPKDNAVAAPSPSIPGDGASIPAVPL